MAKRKSLKKKRNITEKSVLLFVLLFILVIQWALTHIPSKFVTHAEPKTLVKEEVIKHEVLTPTPTDATQPMTKGVETGYCLSIPILFYHHVEPIADAARQGHAQLTVDSAVFDAQMAYLQKQGYSSFSADEAVAALKDHTGLSPKSVVITFDDGYDDAFLYAFPILKKHHLKGNFMIPTGLIGGSDYMTWQNLSEMKNSGSMFIYNHTVSHASLGSEGREKVLYEIAYANQQLSDHLGIKPDIFTYPYGSFSDLLMQVLSENGFIAAFTTLPGTVQCDTMLMQLHRTRIGNSPLAVYGL